MRMYSFLSRHEGDLESSTSYSERSGKLMYDACGGKAALRWAESKLKELGKIEAAQNELNADLALDILHIIAKSNVKL